jgi:hypothetical protein
VTRRIVVLVALSLLSLALAAPAGAQSNGTAPIGSFDDWTLNDNRTISVYGWAADADRPGQSVRVQFFIDGTYVGASSTGVARPDVPGVHPFAGGQSGWQFTIGGSAFDEVCAYALDEPDVSSTLLGCRRVHDGIPSPRDPIGSVDVIRAAPGILSIAGWVGDPDASGEALDVHLYVDGRRYVAAPNGVPRPDVAAVFPAVGGTTGFDLTLPAVPGPHSLCVYGINTGAGHNNTTLGCRDVVVPGAQPGDHDPKGSLDVASVLGAAGPTLSTFAGWAFDPDAPDATTTIRLRVLQGCCFEPQPSAAALLDVPLIVTGVSRADVPAVFSEAGPATGFEFALSTGRYARVLVACAYAVNVGAGSADETLLGCRGEYA